MRIISGFGLPTKYAVLPVASSIGAIAAGGDYAVLGGTGQVAVGADELRAVRDKAHGLENVLIIIGVALADDDIVGIDIVHGYSLVMQRHDEPCAADDVRAASGRLRAYEARGGKGARVEMTLVHLKPHAPQLLLKLLGRALRGIGEEEKVLVLTVQPIDEFFHSGQQPVAVVNNTVHIAYKAFFVSDFI